MFSTVLADYKFKTFKINVLLYDFHFRPLETDIEMFGLNWSAVWVKIASSWACVLIYVWTLFIPKCCPGRDLRFMANQDHIEGGIENDEVDNLNAVETITSKETVV